MRRLLLPAILAGLTLANAGCLIQQYPSDPNERMDALLNQSEDERQLSYEWRRIWFNDQPSHMTPERIHGGIMP
jgi:Mg-chelatase subunit ChlI